MKKILFVCNQGQNRSPTAAKLFSKKYETDYTGIYSDEKIKDKLIWADEIVCMESSHRKFIAEEYPREYMMKKIITLEIPDIYKTDQEELIELLKKQVKIKCVL